jgi:drug/metabolite transporter (DMT)-like permease
MTTNAARTRRLAYGAWIAVCLIWGTTYLAIRVTLETMPPMLMSGWRWLLAGAMLTGILRARGYALVPRQGWGRAALLGFLLLVLGNGLVAWAEQWVPSGLTAVIVAASPFWMVGIEAAHKNGEPVGVRVASGLALGFSGIVLLVWPDLGGSGGAGFIPGVIALQIACLAWAIGSSYSRRHPKEENLFGAAAAQMIAGGAMMVAFGTLHGEWRALHAGIRSGAAFAYLTTVGSIGGFVAYTYALRHLPIAVVSLYAYINPIIAVALGVLLLAERFDSRTALAAALVLGGVAIVQSRRAATPWQARIEGTPDLDEASRIRRATRA